MSEEKAYKEKMELSHEPVPGYIIIFHLAVIISVIWLGIIFWRSF